MGLAISNWKKSAGTISVETQISNYGEPTHIQSFIYPALEINNKQIIHKREELEEFLKETPTVPHDRSNLFNNCDPKNPRKISKQDLQAMY